MTNRRWKTAAFAVFIIFLAVICWPVPKIYSAKRYRATVDRIQQKIEALRIQRPRDVSPDVWEATVGWAGIAFGNVFFFETHTPYTEMIPFERDLDEKLTGPIDIPFFEWFWARLAKTGPHGRQYVSRIKWTWDDVLENRD